MMMKIIQLGAFAALAATSLATVAAAQDAVIQTTTASSVTRDADDQTVTHTVVKQETVVPAALVATHTVRTIMASPKDDAKVTLIGTIGAKVAKNTYAFTDRTGVIEVEIDKKKMPANLAVGQMVRIDGEIDWSAIKRHVKIDVDHVTPIQG